MKEWGRTYLNAFLSTAPVIFIVAILSWTGVTPFGDMFGPNVNGNALFWLGSLCLFVGVAFFSIGTDNAMSKIGEHVGATMTKQKDLAGLILITFLLGVFVTIAEPDLAVLASTLPIDDYLFILIVGLGVGIFLVIGVLRILFQKSLKIWLLVCYALIFALALLVNETYIPTTFDSGGVTTGPVTVPFILSFGVGIATSRAGNKSDNDSFGLTAFCSVGPLIVVLIFGLFNHGELTGHYYPNVVNSVAEAFGNAFKDSSINVAIAMGPIIAFFFIYNAFSIHLPKKEILKIVIGLFNTYVGLVLFLSGVAAAFTPIAGEVGTMLANRERWLLFLVAGLIGLVVVLCEPAVQVLVTQVEKISDGQIKRSHMLVALSLGIAAAVILAAVRIIYDFSIFYYIVPGYIIAIGLSLVVPEVYVGIAFDSGGVASGPMTSAFIVPFALGLSHAVDPGDVHYMTNAFGVVALVAMMPIIVIQLIGFSGILRRNYEYRLARKRVREENDNQIIHFGA